MSNRTTLYSFRRCPYAIRARLAIASAGVPVALREIRLQEKPAAFLAALSFGDRALPVRRGNSAGRKP